ncbi:hypothetical protein [Nonomuraea basaltis]|uniref:hypothetical protein n=1 Tax=Nonomuraea basaltis TaxID=2495887 RepID=UPI00110C581B|nr:hypothetical protein [Nonomuraea basaltis]TMR96909.1 hypothetical protein EJK15_20950 [Nonomuraea basaltis]
MSSDELRVPSQRADEVPETHERSRGDEAAGFARDDEPDRRPYDEEPGGQPHDDEPGGQHPRGDLADDEEDDEEYARSEHTAAPDQPDDDDDELRARSPRVDDEYAAAVPGAVVTPVPGTAPGDEEAPYRDPYATTGGDMLAEPEPEPAPHPDPVHTPGVSDETPAHAAPEDVVLFDQDPTQVQARWRDLQSSFVDDPSEAVQRADGLVGEVVESLTSSLTSRTNALRGRWKDAETADTEQLRQALRDYRNVLERLLALSSHETEGTR